MSSTTPIWTHPAYPAIVVHLEEQSGLEFGRREWPRAERSIDCAMSRAGLDDPGRYLSRLQADPVEVDRLLDELRRSATGFLFGSPTVEFLRQWVLPEIRHRRGAEHHLRAWSAACASGEEAWSLAIVLEDVNWGHRAWLLATDATRTALDLARAAAYEVAALAEMDPHLRDRCFRHADGRLVLADRLRPRVNFEVLNLALDPFPSLGIGPWGMDLIVCRNILACLNPRALRLAAARLHATLAEGGWLLTGEGDPVLSALAPLEPVETSAGPAYRRATRKGPAAGAFVGEQALEGAREALARGEYALAAELTGRLREMPRRAR